MSAVAPFISVIVPTYQRPDRLAACLGALSAQRYPRDRYEIVVVDDGSPTAVDPAFGAEWAPGVDLTIIRQPNAGPAAARNVGASRARGTLLAFTDDDCLPDATWLEVLAHRAAEAPGALVAGRTENAVRRDPYAAASHLLTEYLDRWYNHGDTGVRFVTSNNLAVPAGAFREIGGFDSAFRTAAAEDREFCDRWRRSGRPVVTAEAVIRHAHAMTLGTFLRQHLAYGRGAYMFHRRLAAADVAPPRVERLAFYAGMLRYPFTREQPAAALVRSALIVVAQVVYVAGFVSARFTPPPGTNLPS